MKKLFDEVAADRSEGWTTEVNLAEFYYKTSEKFGREVAELRHTSFRHSKISVLVIDKRLTHIAGNLKCIHKGKISLADAYTVAATKILGATLITTDSRLTELTLKQTKLLDIS